MSGPWYIPKPRSCSLFLPGHNPHWIQVLNHLSTAQKEAATVTFLSGNLFRVHAKSGIWTGSNHDPVRLKAAISKATKYIPEAAIEIAVAEPILLVPSPLGRFIFYFAKGELGDCALGPRPIAG